MKVSRSPSNSSVSPRGMISSPERLIIATRVPSGRGNSRIRFPIKSSPACPSSSRIVNINSSWKRASLRSWPVRAASHSGIKPSSSTRLAIRVRSRTCCPGLSSGLTIKNRSDKLIWAAAQLSIGCSVNPKAMLCSSKQHMGPLQPFGSYMCNSHFIGRGCDIYTGFFQETRD